MKQGTFIRLELADKQALERIAAEEERTLSGLIRKIVSDWLKTRRPSK